MSTIIASVESLYQDAKNIFRKEFNLEPQVAALAPGRVNLIGEHTDYNDGFVLPMALPLVTLVVGSKLSDNMKSVIITTNEEVEEPKRITLDMPNSKTKINIRTLDQPKWANYVRGVIANYIGEVPSFMAVISSNVPMGGGLSSSAALEIATYMFLDALNGQKSSNVNAINKILACQKAEHDYAHVPCGVMDQYISLLGKNDHVLLIDCRSLSSKPIPFLDQNMIILITNSNVKHELSGTEYSTRKDQCLKAASMIEKSSLRDATQADIQHLSSICIDKVIIKRASHVVREIERTIDAAKALEENNYKKFGQLMNESHQSLKTDYEVSCRELDQLVDLALEVNGVLGSRMTGGGFGGCTVTLVHKNAVNNVIKNINEKYDRKATFFICKPSEGAKIL